MNTTEKKSRHPHADIIKAWLDGEDVQIKLNNNSWVNYAPAGYDPEWPVPSFYPRDTFRIKPKPVTIRYRVALFKDKGGTFYTGCYDRENGVEEVRSFVKWLTDWVEVEVPSDHVLTE